MAPEQLYNCKLNDIRTDKTKNSPSPYWQIPPYWRDVEQFCVHACKQSWSTEVLQDVILQPDPTNAGHAAALSQHKYNTQVSLFHIQGIWALPLSASIPRTALNDCQDQGKIVNLAHVHLPFTAMPTCFWSATADVTLGAWWWQS